jgi:GNAT superfamily N-acetyltransferase
VRVADGVTLMSTKLPVRLFNQVLISGDDATDDALRTAIAAVRERTPTWVANLRVGIDDRFLAVVHELGLVPLSLDPWMPGMAMWPLPASPMVPVPGDHEIRRITDAAGLADHVIAAAAGFGMPAEWLEGLMGEAILDDPGASVYVGYTDGVPVTTGLGVVTGRTIGVYNISTVPEARQRGYGAAMTMRVVDDGVAAGCDVAILQASEMGKPIYERLGFRTVVDYVGWADPATMGDG